MARLSVVMIVKNEADCLGACLESVRHIADEIVIGDTGSTDGTRAIAEEHGAIVFDVPWRDDFAAARNAVLARATGDWLLHLDADEVVDREHGARFRALADGDGFGIDGYWVTLANYADEPGAWRWKAAAADDEHARGFSGYIGVELVRFFRNGLGIEYRESVHENLGTSLEEVKAKLARADLLIHHYGYAESHPRAEAKRRYYFELARRKADREPDNGKAWRDLASAARAIGERVIAEEAARRALALDGGLLDTVQLYSVLLIEERRYDEARAVLEAAVDGGDAPAQFLSTLGAIANVEGRLEEARGWFAEALKRDGDHVATLLNLARTCDMAGNAAEAESALARAAGIAPRLGIVQQRREALALREAGRELLAGGDHVGALQQFVAAMGKDTDDPLIHLYTGETLAVMGLGKEAAESCDRAVKLAPYLGEALAGVTSSP